MTPTGWHDPARFADFVMRFSPAREPWATSLRRLAEAVRADALALGVPAALTPQRVAYAYRHHASLGVMDGGRVPKRPPLAPDEVIEAAEMKAETRRTLDEFIRAAEERRGLRDRRHK